jgi:hypothetical protein
MFHSTFFDKRLLPQANISWDKILERPVLKNNGIGKLL